MLNRSQGNPGAMNFIVSITQLVEVMRNPQARIIRDKIQASKIKGSDLWVLWSDLGGKDLFKTSVICEIVPTDVLEDACSRQDCSGRELIKKYL